MHTMWKGSISFGLVNVPVKMYAATESQEIKFRSLHDACHTPMNYARMCPTCKREIEWKELVKGYELEPGRFVVMTEEELEALAPDKTRTITISEFVDLSEIDPIFFKKSYFLAPDGSSAKAYSLLQSAMEDSGKIAIARFVMRDKENLCMIRTYKNYLLLETIFFPAEVRGIEQLPELEKVETDPNELKMAHLLIDNLTVAFDPTRYQDEYREQVLVAIREKEAGDQIAVPEAAEPPKIADFMKALQASLDQTQTDRGQPIAFTGWTDQKSQTKGLRKRKKLS